MKKVEKGFMSFAEGFTNKPVRTDFRQVDWNKCKQFIEKNKDKLLSVEVGLAEDWSFTSGEVWNSNSGYIPQEQTYVYACSNWATPSMSITYLDGTEETLECWEYGDDSDSYFEGM